MFLKTTISQGHKYLQIIQSYRKEGKVRHKVIANLGRADVLAEKGLENIIASLQKFVKISPNNNSLRDISKMKEKARVNYGYLAYKYLWNKCSITSLLESFLKNRKVKFAFEKIVFSLVINRLLSPSSKHYHYHHRDRFLDYDKDLELHQIYRALDVLAENKEAIEKELFERNRNLFNMQVDIVFYDVTTYHFESQRADDLRDFGFSKANKINEVQVVMGLIIDREGRPIGYELFPGNTFEGKTMLNLLEKLKKIFMLNQVIIVADKGLNSKINFKEIKDRGFDYIVSAKIKNMSKKIQKEIFAEEGYKNRYNKTEEGQVYRTKVIDYENNVIYIDEETGKRKTIQLKEKLVCVYSSKRARKDRRDRERAVEKANKLIEENNYSLLTQKKGYKKYIKTEEEVKSKELKISIDEKRIKTESRFDGYSAIEYSREDLQPDEVIEQYHNLYRIEESFRILKSTMRTRPIYLRTPEHISGHFIICFFAFILERELEIRLRKREIEFSPNRIKEALNSMEFSNIQIEKESLYLKGKHNQLASKIFSTLRINQPNNLLDHAQVSEFMKV
ncbi:MAG: IS1634 family transposase [Melioribacteraceae bacterium]|nr:IS1634 family transposase [Melioribacteraceae bacterium]